MKINAPSKDNLPKRGLVIGLLGFIGAGYLCYSLLFWSRDGIVRLPTAEESVPPPRHYNEIFQSVCNARTIAFITAQFKLGATAIHAELWAVEEGNLEQIGSYSNHRGTEHGPEISERRIRVALADAETPAGSTSLLLLGGGGGGGGFKGGPRHTRFIVSDK